MAIEGRLQTRTWDDDQGKRHWKTEIVAAQVEMLSGRRKKDYASESAAEALAAQAAQLGVAPHELAAATLDQELDDDDLVGEPDDTEAEEPVTLAA